MRSTKRYSLMAALVLIASVAWAQPPGPGFGPGPEGGPTRERIRERIKTMKIWKLTESVGLTSEQSQKFFPIYNMHQKKLEELDVKRDDIVNRLERATGDSQTSDKEIGELTKSLNDIPRQVLEERDKFYKEISPILPLRQQAKLMVFEERFKQRLQQFVREVRRDFRGGGMGD
jgi:Spy/CpxP family protein refolding chaperone